MGLFSPAWKSKNEGKAVACVERTTDQATLERIAQEGLTSRVRMKAAMKLTEPERVNRIAAQSPDHFVRSSVADRVTDQTLLKRLAGQDENFLVRAKSLRRIEDDLFLSAYAIKINHNELAQIAVGSIRIPIMLATLACGCQRDVVIRECLKRLGDHPADDVLRILAASKQPLVRQYTLPRLDAVSRARAAREESDPKLRALVIGTLSDKEALFSIAEKDEAANCRSAALTCLQDKKLCDYMDRDALYRIATEDSDVGCRSVAYKALKQFRQESEDEWWQAHIDPQADDQRLALLLRRSRTDASAAREVADRLITVRSINEKNYIHSRCTIPVVEALEARLSGGDKGASKALCELYMSKQLNAELKGHARTQESRITAQHKDGMVDSTVCGETFTHADYKYNETIAPL